MKIAVISDIHSNMHAFRAVLNHIKKQKVKKIFSLGDNIDYGGQPNEVTALIRKMGIPCVKGNHELALFDRAERNRYRGLTECSLYRSIELLAMDHYDYYRNVPLFLEFRCMRFVHGIPPDDCTTYICRMEPSQIAQTFSSYTNKICFVGHTHIPALAEFNGEKAFYTEFEGESKLHADCRYLINPGSVGQPRNGNPDSSYMTFDTDKLLLRQHYIRYDIDSAAGQIIKNGFPEDNAERLYRGL